LNKRYHQVLDKKGQEYLHFVRDAASRMDSLLVDLLDYSRVNTQDLPLQPVKIGNVLLTVQSTFMPKFMEMNVDFKADLDKMPIIRGYSSQLSQLFQNLIGNALKYQNELKPTIEINVQTEDDLHIFSIKDNGIGIEAEHHERIFDMFNRLHTRQEYEGTGIGLATCKKIVQRHGGDIWVESDYGKGSVFYFTIPIAKFVEENEQLGETVLGVSSN